MATRQDPKHNGLESTNGRLIGEESESERLSSNLEGDSS